MTSRTQNKRPPGPATPPWTPQPTMLGTPELDPAHPPLTGNQKLDNLLHDVANPSLEQPKRQAAQNAATWLSVKEGEGAALEWLSLYDTAGGCFGQDGATLNLATSRDSSGTRAYLNIRDREFISAWLSQRTPPKPISLDLSEHQFTNEQARWLAGLLLDESAGGPSGCRSPLRSLTIDYCELAAEHMTEIAKGLGMNSSVKELRYRRAFGTSSQDEQLIALAKGLKGNRTLQSLDLDEHSSKRGLGDVFKALVGNGQLQKLRINRAAGTTSDARALGKLLKTTQSLAILNIGSAQFKEPGTFNGKKGKQWQPKPGKKQEIKRRAIKKINALRHKPPASIGMFEGLADNRSLTTLTIDGFPYEDFATQALASFIGSEGGRLQVLTWSHVEHQVSNESRAALMTAIRRNQTLISVEIPYSYDEASQGALAEVAERNLRNQTASVMGLIADRSLQLKGGFHADVIGAVLNFLPDEDLVNLALAKPRPNITTAPDGANNDGLGDARKHR